jgi:plasmid stabilization system protein ParE
VAKVGYAPAALLDLERLEEFAEGALELIFEAVEMLERHPLLGREVEHGLRELVISRGRTGYVALYRLREGDDTVLVLAVRHQRELAGP